MKSEDLTEAMKWEAERFIEERVRTSGVPFPLVGRDRDLCVLLMAAFASVVLVGGLQLLERSGCGPAS